MASQITSLADVYWGVYSGADQRKRQSSASLAFVRGIHRWPVNSPHKGPVTRKMFLFDDVMRRHGHTAAYNLKYMFKYNECRVMKYLSVRYQICHKRHQKVQVPTHHWAWNDKKWHVMIIYLWHPLCWFHTRLTRKFRWISLVILNDVIWPSS